LNQKKKVKEIMKDGKALLLAFDHAVEHGPSAYEGIDLSPERIARIACRRKGRWNNSSYWSCKEN